MALVDGKKDIVLGVDHDPDDRLKMDPDPDGLPVATRDGKHITPTDFVDATQENIERIQKGKKTKSIGYFSGIGPGTLRKSYE
jgi:hypothetical protein